VRLGLVWLWLWLWLRRRRVGRERLEWLRFLGCLRLVWLRRGRVRLGRLGGLDFGRALGSSPLTGPAGVDTNY
jgi:hypothetical protein